MTLLHSRRDELTEDRVPTARAISRLRGILGVLHQAIVTAKLRRLRSELMFQSSARENGPAQADDAMKTPRRPLILGDKWDF